HVERCLGCLACEPACPSGVQYRDLINPFRALSRDHLSDSISQKLRHFLSSKVLPFPSRFRLAALAGTLTRPLSSFLPRTLRPMLNLLPARLPQRRHWPHLTCAQGKKRARVALLAGCVQQVLEPDINTATIQVLARNGVEVVIPS